jgi:flagellar basal body-associated protein FliL
MPKNKLKKSLILILELLMIIIYLLLSYMVIYMFFICEQMTINECKKLFKG